MDQSPNQSVLYPRWILFILFAGSALVILAARETKIPFLSDIYQKTLSSSKAETLNYYLPDFNKLGPILESPERFSEGDYHPYIQYYSRVREMFPEMAQANGMLGFFYYYSGDKIRSLKTFQEAKERELFFWHLYNLAMISWEDENYLQAALYFKEAVKIPAATTLKAMGTSRIYRQIGLERVPNLTARLKQAYAQATIYLGLSLKESGRLQESQIILRNFPLEEVNRLKSQPVQIRMF